MTVILSIAVLVFLLGIYFLSGRLNQFPPLRDASGRRSYFPGSVFKAAYEKDPELYDRLAPAMGMPQFWREWIKTYPEDFPDGGMTSVTDRTAIKPK